MGIDRAGAAEFVAGEARLNALGHGIDAAAAFALQHRVDIGRILGPGLGDERTPAIGVGLVPHGDVAVDEFGPVGHVVRAQVFRHRERRGAKPEDSPHFGRRRLRRG